MRRLSDLAACCCKRFITIQELRPQALLPSLITAAFLLPLMHGSSPAVSPSTFFSTASEESFSTYQMAGDGDLWPSCWASDGNVYAANGDGSGFSGSGFRFDIAVSRISGMPPQLTGTTVGTNVGTNWSGHDYNRKPTGMLCVNGAIYLAFQNLNLKNFGDAPAASIARSIDHGATWTWDETKPMFGAPGDPNAPGAYKFTTIFFLDYGRNSEHAPGSYVYAYGLDNNWREQNALYLARVANRDVQNRSSWTFFTGVNKRGEPTWSADLHAKIPVLTDERKLYPQVLDKEGCGANQAVVSQGGVVYDAPLNRYIFASWSCSTHQLYEAPNPWGPWRLFLSKDFGRKTTTENRGQYGTNIPSKFISLDGKTLWLQSNVCCGGNAYTYALRKIYLQPQHPSKPDNPRSRENLGLARYGARAISKSARHGALCGVNCFDVINSGNTNASEDDDDGEDKTTDWWGYIWPKNYNLNEVIYETGRVSSTGGWFSGNLQVQVRQDGRWVDVTGLTASPPYIFDQSLPSHRLTTFRFDPTWGDGVRVVGTPGGTGHFTSISQLGAHFDRTNLIDDASFEYQVSPNISGRWHGEGPGNKGITRFEQRGHSGVNEAWLESGQKDWNAIVQTVEVRPETNYYLSAWVRSDFEGSSGRLGVRRPDGRSPLKESAFASATRYKQITLDFNSGEASRVDVYIGSFGENGHGLLEIDDFALRPR